MPFRPQILIALASMEESNKILDLFAQEESGLAFRRVMDAADLTRSLSEDSWDMIIADWRLIQIAGQEGKFHLQDVCAQTPLILIADSADEDEAVRTMDLGVRDVIRREKMARIARVIQRELRPKKPVEKSEFSLANADRMDFGVWEWELETDEFLLSPGWCRIHGCEQVRLTIHGIMVMVVPEDVTRVVQAFRAAWEDDKPIRIEYRIFRQDHGEMRRIAQFGEIIYNEQGKAIKVLGVTQDINEQNPQ